MHESIRKLWKRNFPAMTEVQAHARLKQVVFAIRNETGEVVGVSTCYKAYISQLENHLFAFRCFIDPAFRIPGLTSTLLVKTRDFLEQTTEQEVDEKERCIGMITLVENDRIMKFRNEAIWPASRMAYIGNSPKGYHIRVYYFKKALI